jgi:Na+/H+ antiporter NhaC
MATVFSSIGVNLATGEQYLSILIPGQSYKPLYDKLSIKRIHLARSLEDGGTLINPLIPWGVFSYCQLFFRKPIRIEIIGEMYRKKVNGR